MKWSLKVGRVFGIEVYLHFTFLLLLVFLGIAQWTSTREVASVFNGVGFILLLFGCIALHVAPWPRKTPSERRTRNC